MKLKLLYFTFILFPLGVFSQENSVKESMPTIVIPENYDTQSFRELLVEEATKNVSITRDALNEVEIERYRLGISKAEWLNYITVSGNLNEITLNPSKYANSNQALFFPRYNFGISIPLGTLFTNSYNTKIARSNLAIAKEKQRYAPIQLRSEVLSKFEDYIQARELLKFQSIIFNDEETVHTLNERKFKSNEISLEEFNNSSKRLFTERTKSIELQRTYAITKYELEAIVGALIIDNK
jgi:outer membrane protein TolC